MDLVFGRSFQTKWKTIQISPVLKTGISHAIEIRIEIAEVTEVKTVETATRTTIATGKVVPTTGIATGVGNPR